MKRLWAPALCVLVMGVALPAACTSGGVVGGECRSGLLSCHGDCLDVSADPQNCGACDKACGPGVACSAGVCEGQGDSGNDADSSEDAEAGDATDEFPDAVRDVVSPDAGDGSTTDAGDGSTTDADDGSTTDAGDGSTCNPPFDTAAACGDCNTKCIGVASICSPSDGGFACVPLCDPPLVQCGDQCVDLTTDPANCGQCFKQCPTGLCQASTCVGARAGHIVLSCINYTQVFQTSPQTTLLGNAVFLPLANPVRVLAYSENTPAANRNKVDQAIGWAAAARGRAVTLNHAVTAADASTFNVIDDDVFLIYDQPNAPVGTLNSLGASWATKLDSFVRAGGTVIVLSGGGGASEMDNFMTGAGLLSISAETDVTGSQLYNRAPADGVGLNVLSPFLALTKSCTFTTPATPDASTSFVVTDTAPGPTLGKPVVVHLIRTP